MTCCWKMQSQPQRPSIDNNSCPRKSLLLLFLSLRFHLHRHHHSHHRLSLLLLILLLPRWTYRSPSCRDCALRDTKFWMQRNRRRYVGSVLQYLSILACFFVFLFLSFLPSFHLIFFCFRGRMQRNRRRCAFVCVSYCTHQSAFILVYRYPACSFIRSFHRIVFYFLGCLTSDDFLFIRNPVSFFLPFSFIPPHLIFVSFISILFCLISFHFILLSASIA